MIHNISVGAAIAADPANTVDRFAAKTGASQEGCTAASEFSMFLADVLDKLDQAAAEPAARTGVPSASAPSAAAAPAAATEAGLAPAIAGVVAAPVAPKTTGNQR